MKAITIYEPWASLVALGAKKIETRSWPTNYRGPIAIHAGMSADGFGKVWIGRDPFRSALLPLVNKEKGCTEFHLGHVIAVAELVDCIPTEGFVFSGTFRDISENELAFGDYTPGRYAWVLANVRRITPIPAKGRQRIWNWEMEE